MKTKKPLRSRIIGLVLFAAIAVLVLADFDWASRILSYIQMGT